LLGAHISILDLLLVVAHINKSGPPTAHIYGNLFLRFSCILFFKTWVALLARIVSHSASFGFVAADGCL